MLKTYSFSRCSIQIYTKYKGEEAAAAVAHLGVEEIVFVSRPLADSCFQTRLEATVTEVSRAIA